MIWGLKLIQIRRNPEISGSSPVCSYPQFQDSWIEYNTQHFL